MSTLDKNERAIDHRFAPAAVMAVSIAQEMGRRDIGEEIAAQLLNLPSALSAERLTDPQEQFRKQVAPSSARSQEPGHYWQPDGGVLRFESHPNGEAPHVHTTCAKCGARAWFLEYQWELLAKGCGAASAVATYDHDRLDELDEVVNASLAAVATNPARLVAMQQDCRGQIARIKANASAPSASEPSKVLISAARRLCEQVRKGNLVDDHGHDFTMNAEFIVLEALIGASPRRAEGAAK